MIIGFALLIAGIVWVAISIFKAFKKKKMNVAPSDSVSTAPSYKDVGTPVVSNLNVKAGAGATLGMYKTDFELDVKEGVMGIAVANVKIVNSGWDGSLTPSTAMCAFDDTYKFNVDDGGRITFGSCDIVLDLKKEGWKVMINVNGKSSDFMLRVPEKVYNN